MCSTGGLRMRSLKAKDIIFKSEITPRLISYDPQDKISKTAGCSVNKNYNLTPLKEVENPNVKSEFNLPSM